MSKPSIYATLLACAFVVALTFPLSLPILRPSEFKWSDVLDFEGAMLGTAVAIIGAIFVEGWKRRSQASEDSRVVIDCLQNIITAIDDGQTKARPDQMNYDRIARILEIFEKITAGAPPKRAVAIYQADVVREAVQEYLRHIAGMVIAGMPAGREDETWDRCRANGRTAREAVQQLLNIYRGHNFRLHASTS